MDHVGENNGKMFIDVGNLGLTTVIYEFSPSFSPPRSEGDHEKTNTDNDIASVSYNQQD